MLQVELKKKFKYRLILDESISFGSVGRTGRGLTELYNVPVRTYALARLDSRLQVFRLLRLTCSSVLLQMVSLRAAVSVLALISSSTTRYAAVCVRHAHSAHRLLVAYQRHFLRLLCFHARRPYCRRV